jgi:hypothetical protein
MNGTTQPELRDRLLAPAAIRDEEGNVVRFDVGSLVRRLILFEEYILDSYAMRELPTLIERIGTDGFIALLGSGALRIRADAWTIGQIGQTDLLKAGSRDLLAWGSYAFGNIVPTDREEHIHRCLGEIRKMELGRRTSQRVRRAIVSALAPFPEPQGKWGQQFSADVAASSPILKRATALALRKQFGRSVDPATFDLRVHQVNEDVYTTESNISDKFGLDEEETHRVVERGLLGAATLNQRLEEMELYGAVMGFTEDEIPVFEEKLTFLAAQLDPEHQEARFDRVVRLAGLPDLTEQSRGAIDIERLLELRDSTECREFRLWLRTLDQASDEEIAERIGSIREPIARAVHSDAGKAVRFVATTGVGFIPIIGTALGPALGALDHFVLEKLVPEPGPISFLGQSYPSIFEREA